MSAVVAFRGATSRVCAEWERRFTGSKDRRQGEMGAIKTEVAFEGELLAREEDTPSANDICISISN